MTEHETLHAGIGGPDLPANSQPLSQNRIDRELRLKFSDFGLFVPESLLNAEAVRGDVELIFDLAEVENLVTSGCSRVPLAWLRQRVPSFFRESSQSDGFPTVLPTVLFPWQRVRCFLAAALNPNSSGETMECCGLTPAGGKYLASIYRLKRAEAYRLRKQSSEGAPCELSEQAATLSEVHPTNPSSPSLPNVGPVHGEFQASEKQTVAEDANLPAEELRRQRDMAQREIVRIKGEAERRVATVRAELKALTEERDNALAALSHFSDHENEKVAQLEFENAVQKKNLERALAELEALRARLAAGERAPGPSEPHQHPTEPDPQPRPLSDIKTATGRQLAEKSAPSTSVDSERNSSPGARRRSGVSRRALKMVLLALAGAAVVWASFPLGGNRLPAWLISTSPVLAHKVERPAAVGVEASLVKVRDDQFGGKPAQVPHVPLQASIAAD